jgi:hypothetical protein
MMSLRWCFLSENWKPKNSGCGIAFESLRSLQFGKQWPLLEGLDSSLPLFLNGRESDKLTPRGILEILEWSIPEFWSTKFDLDEYVPTEFTKERLMTECEGQMKRA